MLRGGGVMLNCYLNMFARKEPRSASHEDVVGELDRLGPQRAELSEGLSILRERGLLNCSFRVVKWRLGISIVRFQISSILGMMAMVRFRII